MSTSAAAEISHWKTLYARLKGEHREIIAQRDRLIERLAVSHKECQGLREKLRRALGIKSLHEVQAEAEDLEPIVDRGGVICGDDP